MRIVAPCHQCYSEKASSLAQGITGPSHLSQDLFPLIELDRWPFYEHTCPNGHKSRMTMQNELYELLFQQAVYCIQDGYYREAVGTFHAALERFMEFATEILSYKAMEDLDFDTTWKTIGNRSERQLGAYYITYQLVLGKPPQKVSEERVRFRNAVVHKGELVSRDKSVSHGQYVMDYILNARSEIMAFLTEDEYQAFSFSRLRRICKKDIERAYKDPIEINTSEGVMYLGVSTTLVPSFLSCNICGNKPVFSSIEQCLEAGNQFGLIK